MTAEPIRQALSDSKPFKLVTAEGRVVEVPHREFAALSPSGRLFYVAREGDKLETIDLLLVVSIIEDKGLPMANAS
jgi:protein-L-isoaspartate O-methyltransferase